MNLIFLLIKYILFSILGWITILLWHEFMHIKSQGIKATGNINVEKYGFTCGADVVKWSDIHSYSGGIYTSILCFIVFFLINDITAKFVLFSLGWVNLLYGLYEGGIYSWINKRIPHTYRWRYSIYGVTGVLCIIYWGLLGGFNV